jgi:hypothetical protein
MKNKFLKGAYFTYCKWCRWDGHCNLRHYQYVGAKSINQIDDSPYPGHEGLSWGCSAFQVNTKRAGCNGRIYKSDSLFYPLACECGTVISSLTFSSLFGITMCVKFQPNKEGKERFELAKKIARIKKVDISKITSDDLPEFDQDYQAAMTC